MDSDEWLRVEEAAKLVGGVTAKTLRSLIDAGQIPAYRFGRLLKLRREDVEEYISRCRINKKD